MKTKRRAETVIETHRVLVIKRRAGRVPARCAECAEETVLVTPEEAAAIARISARTLYRRVEAGTVHYVELPGGPMVCLNSLSAGETGARSRTELKRRAD